MPSSLETSSIEVGACETLWVLADKVSDTEGIKHSAEVDIVYWIERRISWSGVILLLSRCFRVFDFDWLGVLQE